MSLGFKIVTALVASSIINKRCRVEWLPGQSKAPRLGSALNSRAFLDAGVRSTPHQWRVDKPPHIASCWQCKNKNSNRVGDSLSNP
jgi:hypothetical protein